jgi:hypothetical protein
MQNFLSSTLVNPKKNSRIDTKVGNIFSLPTIPIYPMVGKTKRRFAHPTKPSHHNSAIYRVLSGYAIAHPTYPLHANTTWCSITPSFTQLKKEKDFFFSFRFVEGGS